VGSEETKSTDQVNEILLFFCLLFGVFLYLFLTFSQNKIGKSQLRLLTDLWDTETNPENQVAHTHFDALLLGERRS
jgi:hypothetical protein